jgi:hypothetical protein
VESHRTTLELDYHATCKAAYEKGVEHLEEAFRVPNHWDRKITDEVKRIERRWNYWLVNHPLSGVLNWCRNSILNKAEIFGTGNEGAEPCPTFMEKLRRNKPKSKRMQTLTSVFASCETETRGDAEK